MNIENDTSHETAILGNGCFWCTEAIFQQIKGVTRVQSGYSGGSTSNPDYKSVCSGNTGHAECLQIDYDPKLVTFQDLLEIFFQTHDPTTLNRQGNDIGSQYRSVIFFRNDAEKAISEQYMKQLQDSSVYSNPIVTTLEPLSKFYPAEEYHNNYFKLNGKAPYCQFVVRPKVEKFVKSYGSRL